MAALRFSANLSLLFTEQPMMQRFQAARDAGFDAVEIQFPYDEDAANYRAAADAAGSEIVLINVPAGDLMQGGAGLAAVPGREAAYLQALEQCIEVARILKPQRINVLAGRCAEAEHYRQCFNTFCANLEITLEHLQALGIDTVFEAVNRIDMPHFLIDSVASMEAVLAAVDDPGLLVQFDVYHMQRMGEDVCMQLERLAGRIGHIQIADVPGRGEPGSGEIDFDAVFSSLRQSGYPGYIGAEYHPTRTTSATLDWLSRDDRGAG